MLTPSDSVAIGAVDRERQAHLAEHRPEGDVEAEPQDRRTDRDPRPAAQAAERTEADEAQRVADLHHEEEADPEQEPRLAGAVERDVAEPGERHAGQQQPRCAVAAREQHPRDEQDEEQRGQRRTQDVDRGDLAADDVDERHDQVDDEQPAVVAGEQAAHAATACGAGAGAQPGGRSTWPIRSRSRDA
ncbi:MAG: hypothetical protein U0R76_15905 [Candidatus Nanopelagicales bacterium]